MKHTLFVCTSCASTWSDGKRVGESGGEKLFKQLSSLHQNWELAEQFSLEPIACMSACNRPCTVSLTAAGKYTYLFGDLSPETAATAVLQCATQYYAKPDGFLPCQERPEPLKKGLLARIPPAPEINFTTTDS
ncbi:MAG: DUF1636 domain-containing protein [Prochloraceae cyanobacterium]|nr:DUF1636 domain-containing protein [Prochloraceae cyanobacterium]